MCGVGKEIVSVIVPNHGRNLHETISSIKCSIYSQDRIEIIIIDEKNERAKQRNSGVEEANGKYLLFLDSDMSIHSYLINECIGLMNNYDGLYIPEIIIGHPVKTFFRQFYNGTNIDAIRFIKREYWVPFDETLTGVEDWDWDRRFRGRKGITAYPLYHHTKSNWRRKLYYMNWIPEYKRRYPNCPELNISYRLSLIRKGIWKKLRKL